MKANLNFPVGALWLAVGCGNMETGYGLFFIILGCSLMLWGIADNIVKQIKDRD